MRRPILVALLSICVLLMALWGSTPAALAASRPAHAPHLVLPPTYQRFLASVGGSRFITVAGVTLHYVEAGPTERPTLLLLYGNPDNIFTWRTIMPQLARHYHVIAPDLVGFGLSGRPAIAYTWATETAYLTAFIAAKHLHHVTLVATDIGGLLGFIYAARYPQNIAVIALWETITAPVPSNAVLGAYCPSCVQFFQAPRTPALAQSQIIDNAQFAAQIYSGKELLHPLAAADLGGVCGLLGDA